MQDTKVFVLSPPSEGGERVYEVIRAAIEEAGGQVLRFDTGVANTNKILKGIRSSDVIVADLTHEHPNLFYELGLAHALRKPTILLRSERSKDLPIPSDLVGFFFTIYDPDNPERLREQIRREVLRAGSRYVSAETTK